MEFYSREVLDHFMNPRNAGVLENADCRGEYCDASHHTTFVVNLKINGAVITGISFQTNGCAASIAASSMMTELAKNKQISDASAITLGHVVDALGGMPADKMFCVDAVIKALRSAITAYQENQT